MSPRFILVGLALHAVAFGLTAAGHHDGLLGTTPLESFPAPGDTAPVTARIVVDGTPDEARRSLDLLDERLGFPDDFDRLVNEGTYVPARLDPGAEDALVFLRFEGQPPVKGETLVTRGPVHTFRSHTDPGFPPVVVMESREVHEALVFRF